MPLPRNPFSVTNANDFSDEQIGTYWVELNAEEGEERPETSERWSLYSRLMAPTDPSTKVILGGKGCGKTHLMRYFSDSLQVIRGQQKELSPLAAVASDGYLGIYFRCGGLDGQRFSGKRQSADVWQSLFPYYFDLALASTVVEVVMRLAPPAPPLAESIASAILALFDTADLPTLSTLEELLTFLRGLRSEIDYQVNNVALTGKLNVRVLASPKNLLEGVPRVLSDRIPELRGIQFLYLLDEFENLPPDKQVYIHTVIRERECPVAYRVGGRPHGVTSFRTLAAQEINRPGAEFELVHLDDELRRLKKQYREFARELVRVRLSEVGVTHEPSELNDFFVVPARGQFHSGETSFVQRRAGERPYFSNLAEVLTTASREYPDLKIGDNEGVVKILSRLRVPEFPLLEKVNILLLYRGISDSVNLHKRSEIIRANCAQFVESGGKAPSEYSTPYGHHAQSLLLQLYHEFQVGRRYSGLDGLIGLSDGQPRNLLVLLKNVYKLAEFRQESPFEPKQKISLDSLEEGALEAADWYFREVTRSGGATAAAAKAGIGRLCELFREHTYSDKPSEASLISFSSDLNRCSQEVRERVECAVDFSLLVRVQAGRKDRNSYRVDDKYQLNRMLLPKWGLPVGRRGELTLSSDEMEAIFGDGGEQAFTEVRDRRASRWNFPFRKRRPSSADATADLFPGLDDG